MQRSGTPPEASVRNRQSYESIMSSHLISVVVALGKQTSFKSETFLVEHWKINVMVFISKTCNKYDLHDVHSAYISCIICYERTAYSCILKEHFSGLEDNFFEYLLRTQQSHGLIIALVRYKVQN